ncbi:type IV toxin-antitoxin system AbiEi family antitoxin [Leucobacter luti]|uniref:Transcriptional regulator with AbiEi antitoxin domain of type IV toxin-antitoxin system n=1 Tax=Leucobacter luti TaxID=340320 RepID=A0A4Q7TYR7_9MICO|nr:type IV toxin-antitoxin system AbiEi family antitoxin [Leucobacter luti]MBL3698084.1 hypothetical protein [Leucobacter luti]RZT64832.1 transcriptional regulator with AbiEi antitoxin domain of type IV toxin-antitoxin system [Leucobacter luti]
MPRVDTWPAAVRSAELTRGTLVRCGPGVRLVGWPETPRTRLAALAPWLASGHVAVLRTAAWVWGATRSPGRPLEVSALRHRGAHSMRATEVRVHEYRLSAAEVARFGQFATTGPLRTVADLLRLSAEFTPAHRIACRLLLVAHGLSRAAVLEALAAGPAPQRRRARERLRTL